MSRHAIGEPSRGFVDADCVNGRHAGDAESAAEKQAPTWRKSFPCRRLIGASHRFKRNHRPASPRHSPTATGASRWRARYVLSSSDFNHKVAAFGNGSVALAYGAAVVISARRVGVENGIDASACVFITALVSEMASSIFAISDSNLSRH